MEFVDVKNDVAFHKVFGSETRKDALISFLNAVLLLGNNRKVVDVEILNPYQIPELKGGKVTILDVKAKDQNGNQYIVEMQVADVQNFNKRVLYYASKSYSSQIKKGEDYKKLKPVFFIGILDFEISQNPNYLTRHKITDLETQENVIGDIEFNFIELPKFNKKENELKSIIEQWIYFIKNAENLAVVPTSIKDKGLKSAYDIANKYTWEQKELDIYDYILMREQDARGRWELATEKELEKANKYFNKERDRFAQEKEKAEQEKEKAEQEKEKAEQERRQAEENLAKEKEKAENSKIIIAKSLLEAGFSVEDVQKHTQLSINEIKKIK